MSKDYLVTALVLKREFGSGLPHWIPLPVGWEGLWTWSSGPLPPNIPDVPECHNGQSGNFHLLEKQCQVVEQMPYRQ